MPYQNIDASLSPQDIKVIRDAFDTILKKSLEGEDIDSYLIFASELMGHKYTLRKVA